MIGLGSPPQVRGKLHLSPKLFKYIGITPAGAGKTIYRVSVMQINRDHPRRCGENDRTLYVAPQTVRITPAGAGKTTRSSIRMSASGDHPRRCGENGYVPKRRQWGIGSPPQVRGKRRSTAFAVISTWDHPRRCGENLPFYMEQH